MQCNYRILLYCILYVITSYVITVQLEDFVIMFSYTGGRCNKILATQVGNFFRGRLINSDDGWLVQDMEIRLKTRTAI